MNQTQQNKKVHLTLRALIVFLLFALCGVALLYLGMHYHKDVAVRVESSLDALEYEGDTFLLAGKLGDKGIGTVPFKYAQKALGEVKPEGRSAWTHTFTVYGMDSENKSFPADKSREDYLVVVLDDGNDYLYYRATVQNPAAETTAPDTTEDETAEE